MKLNIEPTDFDDRIPTFDYNNSYVYRILTRGDRVLDDNWLNSLRIYMR